jgi:membrane-bound lytic murein transglycosylase B
VRRRPLLLAAVAAVLALPGAPAPEAPTTGSSAAFAPSREHWSAALRTAREALEVHDAALVAAARRAWAAADDAVLAGAGARRAGAEREAAERWAATTREHSDSERDVYVAVAVATYVNGTTGAGGVLDALDDTDPGAVFRRQSLARTATIVQEHSATAAAEGHGRAEVVRRLAAAEDDRAQARLTAALAEHDAAVQALADLTASREPLLADLERARVDEPWPGTDLPGWMIGIYRAAATAAVVDDPGCRITWHLLAGIGFVESRHARFGAGIDRNGTVPPILGPPLDGVTVPAAIPDTDGGTLDGDPLWERAVGPMQFIPSTWRAFGVDANADGVADPNNLWDATASAARYLCATRRGADLSDFGATSSALRAYNPSAPYAVKVLGHASDYRFAEYVHEGWADLHVWPTAVLLDRQVMEQRRPPDLAPGGGGLR